MKRSTDRILTTHVGSLPRPDDLFELMLARMDGKPVDEQAYAARVRQAVADSVKQQADAGLDVVSDGEMGKPSFITYASQRLAGLEKREGTGRARSPTRAKPATSRNTTSRRSPSRSRARRRRALMVCTGPITYKGHAAAQGRPRHAEGRARRTSTPPRRSCRRSRRRTSRRTSPNEYYPSAENYVFAIAEAMREEYKAIVDAGFLLQIDDPFLVTYYITQAGPRASPSAASGRSCASRRSITRCKASRADRVRFHTCYSINMGPRVHDMQLKDIIDIILKVKRRRLHVRGGESAPRARMEGVEARQAAGRQGADPGRHHANRPCWSSIRSWWRSGSRDSPAWSAASA